MAGGLVGLLDDIAALARVAAASVDDVAAASGKASAKAAGVVVDDMAVTPAYVQGIVADRELPIIKKIATGSIRNKLLVIVPAALILSAVAPILIDIILMFGGAFLCFEGAEKIYHKFFGGSHGDKVPVAMKGPEAEKEVISGAVRTDFILSAEIMVISLKSFIDRPFPIRAVALVVVAIFITALVYGIVALIVKMDDIGLSLAGRESESSQKLGRQLVAAMPVLLKWLTIIGTAAMLWVGGHILIVGAHDLGWDLPYDIVHGLEESVNGVGGIGGILGWLTNTALSAVVGIIAGAIVVAIVSQFHGKSHDDTEKAELASH